MPPLGYRGFGISTITGWPGAVQLWSQQRPGCRFFVIARGAHDTPSYIPVMFKSARMAVVFDARDAARATGGPNATGVR